MAIRLRTRITLTFEFITTLTIVLMAAIVAFFFVGRITYFYYRQGQMLNLIGQSNIEHALVLPERVSQWTGEQAVLTGLAVGEMVRLAQQQGMPDDDIAALLQRLVEQGAEHTDPPILEGIRVRQGPGARVLEAGEKLPEEALPEGHPENMERLHGGGAAPTITSLPSDNGEPTPRYLAVVPAPEPPVVVELASSHEFGEALRRTFDIEDVMTRYLLNAEVDRIAIVNMEGKVEASAGESFYPDQPIADKEVVDFCVAFLTRHRDSVAAGGQGIATPADPTSFVDFLDVENEKGEIGLGVATLLDPRPGGPPRALFIQHRTAGMVETILGALRNVVVVGLGMMILSGIAGVMLSRRLAQPLTRLADAAQTIAAGNVSYRVPVQGDKEIRVLARAFNQMVDSIQRRTIELQRETQIRERLESDLRIGADIQKALLPDAPPRMEGIEVIGWSEAAREVGGDFYDFLQLDKHRLGLALGDASGKGLPAALLVTECSSIIRALAGEKYPLAELLTKTNNALVPKLSDSGHFITLFLAEVNARRNRLYFTLAGHNPPLLVPASGEPRWLVCNDGLPLGIIRGRAYTNHEVNLEEGDTLIVYSDGITDARNTAGEFFGTKHLEEVVLKNCTLPLPALLDAINAAVREFLGEAQAADDMSLLLVRRTPSPEAHAPAASA
jgi:serine phosphatase RsbU (regulator of sigma subunit)